MTNQKGNEQFLTGQPLNKGTKGGTIFYSSREVIACLEVGLPLKCVIRGKLSVQYIEGSHS